MEALSTIDSDLFLFLNGLHADWMDGVMVLITQMWVWLPLYLLLIYWTVKQYGKRCWWIFLAVALVVLCSDQLSAHVCKPLFQRLRPCYNADLQGLIHLPKGMAGGQYGFVSSHAANTFAIAAFLTAALRKNYKWMGIALYLWAFISSYSRIYIGYHYPGDILCGAVLGILVGLTLWKVFQLLVVKKIWKSEQ
ncbi:MAG: phosphatase PAP2 family protein [Bacteroidales bacterium]|nr:phosphatase PAP2 family protein [Bacteroidales bacterium]